MNIHQISGDVQWEHFSKKGVMFWKLRIRPGEDERNVYAEADGYGIICDPHDLQGIVERLDKYIKRQKCVESV